MAKRTATLNADNIARYRANLRAAWEAADTEWVARGLGWYEEAIATVVALNDKSAKLDKRTLMGVVATLSIDNTWPKNLRAVGVVLESVARGGGVPKEAHRYGAVKAKVEAILAGADPEWVSDNYGKGSDAYKVKRFFANFMGDTSVATIDRWANRLCVGDVTDTTIGVPSGRDYLEKEAAYQLEAEAVGVTTDKYQAAQWAALLQEKGYGA